LGQVKRIKIGVIVNDVASVNIDQKLISNLVEGENTMELQNGCVCCLLADELFTSVEQLTARGSRPLDAIVIELSGVADPRSIKDIWSNALQMDHPATKLAQIQNIVTLVDSATFGTDWMSWDTSFDRNWTDGASEKNIPELLAEQVEAADVLLINKVDLAAGASKDCNWNY